MKKRYLFIIGLLSFFLFPRDTFAQGIQNYRPNLVAYFKENGEHVIMSSGYSQAGFQGSNFYIFRDTEKLSKFEYRYTPPPDMFGSLVDLSFMLYLPNFALGTLNSYSLTNVAPIVLAEGSTCTSTGTASFAGNGVTYQQVFSVYCPNVDIKTNDFSIQVFTPSLDYNNGLTSGPYYGVSSFWNYSVLDTHSQQVIDSVKENTEEIKKQTEETKKNTEATKEQTETIKDSDTADASDSANSFFNGFESDDFGLSDIVTMPLSFIKKLSSSTCNNLSFPVPFVNQNVELPCMSSVYKTYFSSFLALYQVITTGLIAYWCCVNIFRLVQGFKDPDKDEIEVLDLW